MRLYILGDFISLNSMLLGLEYWKYDVSSLLLPIYLVYSNLISSHLILTTQYLIVYSFKKVNKRDQQQLNIKVQTDIAIV